MDGIPKPGANPGVEHGQMHHFQGGEQYNMATGMPQGYQNPAAANYANADQNFYQVQTVNSGVVVPNQGNPYFKQQQQQQGMMGYRAQSPGVAGYHMSQAGNGMPPGQMGFAVRASAQAQGNIVFNNQAPPQMQQMRFVGQAGNQTFELQPGMMAQGQMQAQNPRFVGMYQGQAGAQNVTWYAESSMPPQKAPPGAYPGGQSWTAHPMAPQEGMTNSNYAGPSPNVNAAQVNMVSGGTHNSHSAMLTHMSNAHHHHPGPQPQPGGYIQHPQQPMHTSPHQQGVPMHSPSPGHQHVMHQHQQGYPPPMGSPSQGMPGAYPSHSQAVYSNVTVPKTPTGPHDTSNSSLGSEGHVYHPPDPSGHPGHKQLSGRSSAASGGTPGSGDTPLQSPTHSHTPLPSMQALNQDLQTLQQSSAVTLNIQSNSVVTQTASSTHAVAMTTSYLTPVTQHALATSYPGGHPPPQSQYPLGAMHHQHVPRTQFPPSRHRALHPQHRMSQPGSSITSSMGLPVNSVGMPVSAQTHPSPCPMESALGTMPLRHPKTESEGLSCSFAGDGCGRKGASRSSSASSQGDEKPDSCITVPFGWRRVIENGAITYYSPSNARLCSLHDVAAYLQSEGTCKCGLECPLLVRRVFNFHPLATSKQWSVDDIKQTDDLTKLCNHKKKIEAMAMFQNTTSLQNSLTHNSQTSSKSQENSSKKGGGGKKRKAKTKAPPGPYDGMLVSQLLSQRDKLREMSAKQQPQGDGEVLPPGDERVDPMDELGPITCQVQPRLQFGVDETQQRMILAQQQQQGHFPRGPTPGPHHPHATPGGGMLTQGEMMQQQGMMNFQMPFQQGQGMRGRPPPHHPEGGGFNSLSPGMQGPVSPMLPQHMQNPYARGHHPHMFPAQGHHMMPQFPGETWSQPPPAKKAKKKGKKKKGKKAAAAAAAAAEKAALEQQQAEEEGNVGESKPNPSFLENPTAFLAQQAAMVSRSLPGNTTTTTTHEPCAPTPHLGPASSPLPSAADPQESELEEGEIDIKREMEKERQAAAAAAAAREREEDDDGEADTSTETAADTTGDITGGDTTGTAEELDSTGDIEADEEHARAEEEEREDDKLIEADQESIVTEEQAVTEQDRTAEVTDIPEDVTGEIKEEKACVAEEMTVVKTEPEDEDAPIVSDAPESSSLVPKVEPPCSQTTTTTATTTVNTSPRPCSRPRSQPQSWSPLHRNPGPQGFTRPPAAQDFPASKMLTAAARAQMSHQGAPPVLASPGGGMIRPQGRMPHPNVEQLQHQQMATAAAAQDQSSMMNNAMLFANFQMVAPQVSPGQEQPLFMQTMMVNKPGHIQQLPGPMMPGGGGMPGGVPGGGVPVGVEMPRPQTAPGKEQSPIQAVQNMIHGLEATQNALAIAAASHRMDGTAGSGKRRKSGSSDSGRSSARPASASHMSDAGSVHSDTHMLQGHSPSVLHQNFQGVPQGALQNFTHGGLQGVSHGIVTQGQQMPPLSVSAVTGVTNAITQVIPAVGLQQQPIMHVINPMEMAAVHNGPMVVTEQGTVQMCPPESSLSQLQVSPGQQMMVMSPNHSTFIPVPQMVQIQPDQHLQVHQQGHQLQVQHHEHQVQLHQEQQVMDKREALAQEVQHHEEDGLRREETATPSETRTNCDHVTESVCPDTPISCVVTTTASPACNTSTSKSESPKGSGSKSPKTKKKDRSKKASTPTIASMLSAAQMSSSQVVMVPSVAQPLVQNSGPTVATVVGNGPNGQQAVVLQPAMGVAIAGQNQLNGVVCQNPVEMGQGLIQGQFNVMSVPAGQFNMSQAQAMNVVQTMNVIPSMGGMEVGLMQNFQPAAAAAAQYQDLVNMKQATLLGQQQQTAAQFLQTLTQNLQGQNSMIASNIPGQNSVLMQNIQQNLQQNIQTVNGAMLPVMQASVNPAQLLQVAPGVNVISGNMQEEQQLVTPGDGQLEEGQVDYLHEDGDAGNHGNTEEEGEENVAEQDPGVEEEPPASPCPEADDDEALGEEEDTPGPFSPDELSTLTMPTPNNLTEAVSAVVKSQPIFGDYLDTSDSSSLYSNINPRKNTMTYGGLRRGRGRRKYNAVKKFSLRNVAGRFASPNVNIEVSREHQPTSPTLDTFETSPRMDTSSPSLDEQTSPTYDVHQQETLDRGSPELTPSPLLSHMSRGKAPAHEDPGEVEPGEITQLNTASLTATRAEETRNKCSSASTSSDTSEGTSAGTSTSSDTSEGTLADSGQTTSVGEESDKDSPQHLHLVACPVINPVGVRLKRHLEEDDADDGFNEDDESDEEIPPAPSYPRNFTIGQVVWGPTRGYPSWPGKLVQDSDVKGNYKMDKSEDGKMWVRWFGDHSFSQVEPEKLKTLSEGLESHHSARKKLRKGRKMNTNLEAAIMEAMNELDHQQSLQTTIPTLPEEEPIVPRPPSPLPKPVAPKVAPTKPPPAPKAGTTPRAISSKPTTASKTTAVKPVQSKAAPTKPGKQLPALKASNRPKTNKKKKAR